MPRWQLHKLVKLDTICKRVVACFLNFFCPHWLYPAHWFNSGQPESLLHSTEIIPTGPVPAALPAALVQHRLQDWHTVQPNNVTHYGELFVELFFLSSFIEPYISDFHCHLFFRSTTVPFLTSLPLYTPRCARTHILNCVPLSTPCVWSRSLVQLVFDHSHTRMSLLIQYTFDTVQTRSRFAAVVLYSLSIYISIRKTTCLPCHTKAKECQSRFQAVDQSGRPGSHMLAQANAQQTHCGGRVATHTQTRTQREPYKDYRFKSYLRSCLPLSCPLLSQRLCILVVYYIY